MGSLTDRQMSIIRGKLLGDGSLRKKRKTLLEINHSHTQKQYVFWLYDELKNLVRTKPKKRRSGRNRSSYRFTTLSLESLNDFYKKFYGSKGRKHIPATLKLDGLTMAAWFMDDGSKSRRSIYLNTQQFSMFDQKLLLEKMEGINILATLNKDKSYHRIRLSQKTIDRYIDMIRPHLIESMLYKLP